MNITIAENVSVDGVMQGSAGRMRIAGADSSAADGPRRSSTTRPRRSSTMSTSVPTRSCLAGAPTRSSPAPGERGTIRATARSAPERDPGRPAIALHDQRLRGDRVEGQDEAVQLPY